MDIILDNGVAAEIELVPFDDALLGFTGARLTDLCGYLQVGYARHRGGFYISQENAQALHKLQHEHIKIGDRNFKKADTLRTAIDALQVVIENIKKHIKQFHAMLGDRSSQDLTESFVKDRQLHIDKFQEFITLASEQKVFVLKPSLVECGRIKL